MSYQVYDVLLVYVSFSFFFLKLFKIFFWIYCNCTEICIIQVFNFIKSHTFSRSFICMLNCCQKSPETSSLGPVFECLKISNKTFLKTLSGIQPSSLQIKIKNIEQLSVSVKLRYKKHFSMSFLSKIPLTLSSGKQKHLLYRKRMILKTFLQTSTFFLYKIWC